MSTASPLSATATLTLTTTFRGADLEHARP